MSDLFRSGSYIALGGAGVGHVFPRGYMVLANASSATRSQSYIVLGPTATSKREQSYIVLTPKYPPYEDVTIDDTFIDTQFPECISFGSEGGPGFKNSVYAFDSGKVAVDAQWDSLRARYTVQMVDPVAGAVDDLIEFFYVCRGKGLGFRYKDWSDYQITNQFFAVGDGSNTTFQFFKRYQSGSQWYDRLIHKPVEGSIGEITLDSVPLVENTDYTIEYNLGQIVFATAPAHSSIAEVDYMEFDVPVRFDTDELNVTGYVHDRMDAPSVPLIEISL